MPVTLDTLTALLKRRGFIFPGSEIYGGLANSWDYGPLGVELKRNIRELWWKKFVHQRSDMVGIDPAVIMNPKVWEASRHVSEFSDPLVECQKCHQRFRADQINSVEGAWQCENCGERNTNSTPRQFNLLFRTTIGPVVDSAAEVYLRGELAQAMFVDFPLVLKTTRVKVPFGIAAQGRCFRNEITPGNFIFRTREFDIMEFEYFVHPSEWEKWFDYWREAMHEWIRELGVDSVRVHEHEIPPEERAHYSERTIDFEYDYPFGRKELYGLAYRTDFDLKNHMESSGADMIYIDPESDEKYIPHVIEPTFGLDRTVLVVLLEAYHEETKNGTRRVCLKLPPTLAPYQVAVFPLVRNKPELIQRARDIYDSLKKEFRVAFDDRGNIGKRYFSQDEIGTPYCATVDHQTLEDRTVTIRDRDTTAQERIAIDSVVPYITEKSKRPAS